MLTVIGKTGDDEIASVYLAKTSDKKLIEFVESVQPPLSRDEKWVIIVSTLFGCPVACPICDAGTGYQGKLSKEEIFAQIDYLVAKRYPDKKVTSKKFKIQFSRMGEPSLNAAVLDVLRELPLRFDASGLLPSLSTVAPKTSTTFFDELLKIKNEHYRQNFQLQFSIHTTDQTLREKIIPIQKWNFSEIAAYATKFHSQNDKKITLNFALAKNYPFCLDTLKKYFDPKIFLIKITPINPTIKSMQNNLETYFTTGSEHEDNLKIIARLQQYGFEVILSIGELEENKIGSNCGQYVQRYLHEGKSLLNLNNSQMYTYNINNPE